MDKTLRSLRGLATNSFFAAISEVSTGFLFILFILAARYLGDEQFGVFSFALAFVNIFGVINSLGLRYVYVREVSRDQEQTERYLNNVLLIQSGLSILSLLLIFVVINWMGKDLQTRWLVYLLGAAEALRSLKFLIRFVFRAADRFDLEAYTVLFERIGLLVLGVALMATGHGVIWLAISFLIIRVVDTVVSSWIAVRGVVRPSFRPDFSIWRSLLVESMPFALSGVVLLLFYKIDVIFLSIIRTDTEVGWYSAAYKLVEGLVLVPAIFSSTLYPSISRVFRDRTMVNDLFARGVKYIFLAGFLISAVGIVFARDLILLIYGSEYINSVIVLQLVLLALNFIYLRDVGGSVLAAVNLQKESFLISTVILILNVSLNLLFIPRWGYVGASVAIVISEIVYGLAIAGYLYYKQYRIPYLRLALKPLIAALLVAFIARLLPLSVIPALIVTTAGYLLILTAVSFWDPKEIALLRQALHSLGRHIGLFPAEMTTDQSDP